MKTFIQGFFQLFAAYLIAMGLAIYIYYSIRLVF